MSDARTPRRVVRENPTDVRTCPIPSDEVTKALCRALGANPDDQTAAAALVDRYQEMGHPAEAARVLLGRVIRWRRVKAAITGTGAAAARLRTRVRGYCGVASCPRIPIAVVGGDRAEQPPRMTGDGPYHTFRGGGGCKYPGAARRKGYRTEYHADTREITVGVSWLAELLAREEVSRVGS
jgi:hypothetical protein